MGSPTTAVVGGTRTASPSSSVDRGFPRFAAFRYILFPEMESEPDYSGLLRRLDLALVLAKNDVEVERGIARELWDGHLSRLGPGRERIATCKNANPAACPNVGTPTPGPGTG